MQLKCLGRFFSYWILIVTISLNNCSEINPYIFRKIKKEKDITFLNTEQTSKCAEYIAKIFIIRVIINVIINIDNENRKCLEIEHFLSKHKDIKNQVQLWINKSLLREYGTLYTKQITCKMSKRHANAELSYPANLNSLFTFLSSRICSFNKSIWYAWKNVIQIRDGDEKRIKTMPFNFVTDQEHNGYIRVDGLNKQDTFVVVLNSEKELNKSDLFIANLKDSNQTLIEPYKKINAHIEAIMIHPTENIVMYSSVIKNDEYNEYALHMFNPFHASFNFSSPTDFGCKKIFFFGGDNTYILLTLKGQLGMCWLEKDKNNELTIKWSLKKHESTYIDFAPDTSRVTKSGFAPHWAFLTDKGEVLMCNFLNPLVDKTTLFCAIKADQSNRKIEENFYKLHYNNNGTCGVIYQDEGNNDCDKFIIYG